jgi:tetratricopeptide (TPR) repeat protein
MVLDRCGHISKARAGNWAVRMNKNDGYAYLFLAYSESMVGDSSAAIEDFTSANRLLPSDPTVDPNRGRARRDIGRLKAAAIAYVASGELYRRLGLSTDDNRIQE